MKTRIAAILFALTSLGLAAFVVYDRWPDDGEYTGPRSNPSYYSIPTAPVPASCDSDVLCGLWRMSLAEGASKSDFLRMAEACGITDTSTRRMAAICPPPSR